MISRFFIDRPIFAAVLSIVITLTGGIALLSLPVAQYPEITPPAVQVAISYPGASAQVVADTVAAPIEQQVNGVPGMLYMSSQSGNDGSYTLTVTFDLGVNLNTGLVMVQNRLALAMPQLPNEVQMQGINIRKRTADILQVINFYSPDGRYDDIYLSNFATINIKDELLRLDGVSDIVYLGERDYSIRAWLDPQKLAARGMSAFDVANAVRDQNVEAPAGQVGQPPASPSQTLQLTVSTLGRLVTPEQFGDIVVKVGQGGGRPHRATEGVVPVQATPPTTTPAGGSPTTPSPVGLPPTGGVAGGGATGAGVAGGGLAGGSVTGGVMTGGAAIGSSTMGGTASGGSATGTATGGTPSPPTITGATAYTTPGGSTTGGSAGTGGANVSGGSLTRNSAGSAIGGVGAAGGTTTIQPAAGGGTVGGTAVGGPALVAGGVSGPQGLSSSIVRLRNVARVELAAQSYTQACTFDGKPSVGIAIKLLPGVNALDVAVAVQRKMDELRPRFPDGVAYDIAYDTTPFIRESVSDVVRTLLEATVLVAVVVLVFLQSWRATLIPLVAVPVAIVGTFAVMAALHFSLNNISLFGLVLAIGIVVDDAIVVVENVERWLAHGLDPREAARRAMDEVTGPVIAVALVLCAVFVPCAFISGITGQFFRQFAVTIAASTVFSAFNSLTLSPALAAILLKPHGARRDPLGRLLHLALGWFFRLFNKAFGAITSAYTGAVGLLLPGPLAGASGLWRPALVLLAYGGLLLLTYWIFKIAPTGFIPQQDQGRIIVNIQTPDSASLQRTQEAVAQVERIILRDPGVAHTVTISGLSFLLGATSPNFASAFVVLKPFGERRDPALRDEAVMARLRRAWAQEVKDAVVVAFGAPPVPGLSVAGGFKLMVEDRVALGVDELQAQTDTLIGKDAEARDRRRPGIAQLPGLVGVSTQFRSRTPQLYMDIDRTKVESLGVSLGDLNQTLQIYLGSLYVNSFNQFGRYWQVNLQAEGTFRNRVERVNLLEVRNNRGRMVPLGTLVKMRDVSGPVMVQRYNLYTAAPITGNMLPGVSSGPVISAVEGLADQTLPRSMKTEWTELMFMQIRAGNTAMYVFALSVVFVFLALAALYESWSLPLAVILVVPLCLLCSVAGVLFTHTAVNIFVQIGLVVLVGLACKNAILIVEFAKALHEEGRPRFEATLEACRLRLRPILMTSFAFILGVVPLVFANGAGAEMRRSLGTAVFAGMLGVTLFGVFLTPVFFYVIEWVGETRALTSFASRWGGSALLGGLLGVGLVYLLAQVGVIRSQRAMLAGACIGAVVGLLVPLLHGRFRPRPASPEHAPPAYPDPASRSPGASPGLEDSPGALSQSPARGSGPGAEPGGRR
jgi:multidrug efflux pump